MVDDGQDTLLETSNGAICGRGLGKGELYPERLRKCACSAATGR